jgi:hypothetical protein
LLLGFHVGLCRPDDGDFVGEPPRARCSLGLLLGFQVGLCRPDDGDFVGEPADLPWVKTLPPFSIKPTSMRLVSAAFTVSSSGVSLADVIACCLPPCLPAGADADADVDVADGNSHPTSAGSSGAAAVSSSTVEDVVAADVSDSSPVLLPLGCFAAVPCGGTDVVAEAEADTGDVDNAAGPDNAAAAAPEGPPTFNWRRPWADFIDGNSFAAVEAPLRVYANTMVEAIAAAYTHTPIVARRFNENDSYRSLRSSSSVRITDNDSSSAMLLGQRC